MSYRLLLLVGVLGLPWDAPICEQGLGQREQEDSF